MFRRILKKKVNSEKSTTIFLHNSRNCSNNGQYCSHILSTYHDPTHSNYSDNNMRTDMLQLNKIRKESFNLYFIIFKYLHQFYYILFC